MNGCAVGAYCKRFVLQSSLGSLNRPPVVQVDVTETVHILEILPTRRPWAKLPLALGLMAVGVAATWGAWSEIWRFAMSDEEASHIFLVPFVAAWLVFIMRARLVNYRPSPSLLGPALIALGWASEHYGFNHARQSPYHLGAVLVVLGCLVSVMGARLLARVWPAVLVLAFLVPVPAMIRQQIAIPLQTATAFATERILQLGGVPVVRSGNSLAINGHVVNVIEACNGMRMVFPLFLVVYVFCFSLPLRGWLRTALLVLSPAVATVCNVIRIIPTVYLDFYAASPKTAERFHDISGWLMVPICFLLLMAAIWVLQKLRLPVMRKTAPATEPDHADVSGASPMGWIVAVAAPALACAVILAMTTLDKLRIDRHEADGYHQRAAAAVAAVPARIGSWTSKEFEVPQSAIDLLHANATLSRAYASNMGREVGFLLVNCSDTRDMIGHWPPVCYKGQGWELPRTTPQTWSARGLSVPGTEYELTRTEPGPNGPRERKMIIRNFFVLPDGKIVGTMDGVNAAAKDYRTMAYGVTQIQILYPDTRVASWERDEIFATLIGANAPLIEALRSGGIQ